MPTADKAAARQIQDARELSSSLARSRHYLPTTERKIPILGGKSDINRPELRAHRWREGKQDEGEANGRPLSVSEMATRDWKERAAAAAAAARCSRPMSSSSMNQFVLARRAEGFGLSLLESSSQRLAHSN